MVSEELGNSPRVSESFVMQMNTNCIETMSLIVQWRSITNWKDNNSSQRYWLETKLQVACSNGSDSEWIIDFFRVNELVDTFQFHTTILENVKQSRVQLMNPKTGATPIVPNFIQAQRARNYSSKHICSTTTINAKVELPTLFRAPDFISPSFPIALFTPFLKSLVQ